MPVYVSKQTVWNANSAQAMLSANRTLPGAALITPGAMGLFKNDFTPTPQSLIADFTPADFSGYLLTPVALAPPHNYTVDKAVQSAIQTFIATSATPFVPCTVFGWYMADLTGVLWYSSERFTSPMSVSAVGDFIGIWGFLAFNYVQQVSG
jgi:hypothetical protein